MQCDDFTCLQAIYSCPKRAREIVGTLLPFIFFNSFIGYDSYNNNKIMQFTITIENTGHSKNNERESKTDKNSRGPIRPDVNGTQRPV